VCGIRTLEQQGKRMSQSEIKVTIKPDLTIAEPPMFRVIYMNDDTTTVDFVIETLVDFFNYTIDTAHNITQNIHDAGSAVVAVMPYEIAEQKGIEVTVSARSAGFPLQVKIEPES
jgi:ATP-dependent Clp protease adaptor protein ClpS